MAGSCYDCGVSDEGCRRRKGSEVGLLIGWYRVYGDGGDGGGEDDGDAPHASWKTP